MPDFVFNELLSKLSGNVLFIHGIKLIRPREYTLCTAFKSEVNSDDKAVICLRDRAMHGLASRFPVHFVLLFLQPCQ